jgi:hypothetical protein
VPQLETAALRILVSVTCRVRLNRGFSSRYEKEIDRPIEKKSERDSISTTYTRIGASCFYVTKNRQILTRSKSYGRRGGRTSNGG